MSTTLSKRHSRTPVRTGPFPHWSVAYHEAEQRRAVVRRILQCGFVAILSAIAESLALLAASTAADLASRSA